MAAPILPTGKLPPTLLASLLETIPVNDPSVLIGPGVGMDCAVVDVGDKLLVLKSDPITFATDEIGWYMVQVNANDFSVRKSFGTKKTTQALDRILRNSIKDYERMLKIFIYSPLL